MVDDADIPLHASAVYSDPRGGAWVLAAERSKLYRLDAAAVASSPSPSPPLSSLTDPFATSLPLVFTCRDGDSVVSVLFVGTPRDSVACIITAAGSLAVASREKPYPILHQSGLGMEVTCATVMELDHMEDDTRGRLLLSCLDGPYSEVVCVQLLDSRVSEDREPGTAPPTSSIRVVATGLFRISGRCCSLLFDPIGWYVVSVSEQGYVDVWCTRTEQDVTVAFGSPSVRQEESGAPCGPALLVRQRLWLGTDRGCVVILPLLTSQAVDEATGREESIVIEAHSTAITTLLPMSVGHTVWSLAGSKANVYDAETMEVTGTFVFPEEGMTHLCPGATGVETTLWGLCGATGSLRAFTVKEELSNPHGVQYCTREEARRQREDSERAQELKTVLGFFYAHLRDESPVLTVEVDTALDRMEDRGYLDEARHVMEALAAFNESRGLLHEWTAQECRTPQDLPSNLRALMAECREHRRLKQSTAYALEKLSAILKPSTPFVSLDDMVDSVTDLWEEKVLREDDDIPRTRTTDMIEDDMFVEGTQTTEKSGQQEQLVQFLAEERRLRRETEERLSECQLDQREACMQLERTQRLLADRDDQVAMLQRSLLAAQHAARSASTAASQLMEMERRLHEARRTIDDLERREQEVMEQVTAMRPQVEELQTLREAKALWELREQLGKQAMEDLFRTQSSLADGAEDLVEQCCIPDADEGGRMPNALRALQDRVVAFAEWVTDMLDEQKARLRAFRQVYTNQQDGLLAA